MNEILREKLGKFNLPLFWLENKRMGFFIEETYTMYIGIWKVPARRICRICRVLKSYLVTRIRQDFLAVHKKPGILPTNLKFFEEIYLLL